jgi:hypothetical protein
MDDVEVVAESLKTMTILSRSVVVLLVLDKEVTPLALVFCQREETGRRNGEEGEEQHVWRS